MKLILQESITGLGNPGDLVQVRSGYGRNYLLPSGKAIVANEKWTADILGEEGRDFCENMRFSSKPEIFTKIQDIKIQDFRENPRFSRKSEIFFLNFCSRRRRGGSPAERP